MHTHRGIFNKLMLSTHTHTHTHTHRNIQQTHVKYIHTHTHTHTEEYSTVCFRIFVMFPFSCIS